MALIGVRRTLLKRKTSLVVGPPVLTFVGGISFGSHTGAVETYSSLNIGTASGFTTRRIIFVITLGGLLGPTVTNPITSWTVNGGAPVNGAIHVQISQGGTGTPFVGILSANIATGTTATIAVTFNASLNNDPAIAVYSVDDALLISTTPNTGSNSTAAATSLATSSFTQTAGGFTIAGMGFSTPVTTPVVTGYTNDQTGGSTNRLSASLSSIGSTGSVTASSTWTTSAAVAIAAASWR